MMSVKLSYCGNSTATWQLYWQGNTWMWGRMDGWIMQLKGPHSLVLINVTTALSVMSFLALYCLLNPLSIHASSRHVQLLVTWEISWKQSGLISADNDLHLWYPDLHAPRVLDSSKVSDKNEHRTMIWTHILQRWRHRPGDSFCQFSWSAWIRAEE